MFILKVSMICRKYFSEIFIHSPKQHLLISITIYAINKIYTHGNGHLTDTLAALIGHFYLFSIFGNEDKNDIQNSL